MEKPTNMDDFPHFRKPPNGYLCGLLRSDICKKSMYFLQFRAHIVSCVQASSYNYRCCRLNCLKELAGAENHSQEKEHMR